MENTDPHSTVDPSAAEIAAATAAIRSQWTVAERIRRREHMPPMSYRDELVEQRARHWALERKTARRAAQRLAAG